MGDRPMPRRHPFWTDAVTTIPDANPEMSLKVLSLFRQGLDTYAISNLLDIDEWVIERSLHAAMAMERCKRENKSPEDARPTLWVKADEPRAPSI